MDTKPRILIVDTYYPNFLKSLPFDPSSTYEVELRKVLDRSFGTADFYSRNLKALGWDAVDVIANHVPLQNMWAKEHGSTWDVLGAQSHFYAPDVLFMQDLSVPIWFDSNRKPLIAGQCSCPWPGDVVVNQFDLLFTSFPHYLKRIEALGVRAIYNPLAFDPIVLERTGRSLGILSTPCHITDVDAARIKAAWEAGQLNTKAERLQIIEGGLEWHPAPRPHDCVFIGGVGNPSHWRYGMEVLETVAREIPTFKWWGYGLETLPADSVLREKYQGEAWGLDMYEILLRSKIVLNRHGEVAEGYANNMRMYEATGCGAMLLTEAAPNLFDLFQPSEVVMYTSPEEACAVIRDFLRLAPMRQAIASFGQQRTLRDHTYAQRMKVVSETLKEMLCPA